MRGKERTVQKALGTLDLYVLHVEATLNLNGSN
jgi:hypothetical protein